MSLALSRYDFTSTFACALPSLNDLIRFCNFIFFYIHSLIIRSIHTRTMSLLFQILLYPPFNRTWRRNFYGFGNRSYSCLSLPAPVKPRLNSTTSLGNGKDISPWNGQVGKKEKTFLLLGILTRRPSWNSHRNNKFIVLACDPHW